MNWDEYTENTNTGILHPPRDHSFDNFKSAWLRFKIMLREGYWLFSLIALTGFWAVLVCVSIWKPVYTAQLEAKTLEQTDGVIEPETWSDVFANDETVLQTLRIEQKARLELWQNPFYKLEHLLLKGLWPFYDAKAQHSLSGEAIRSRLNALLNVESSETSDLSLTLTDPNILLLQAVKNAMERHLQNQTGQKILLTSTQRNLFSKDDSLRFLETLRNLAWMGIAGLALVATYILSPSLAKNQSRELALAFPFPVLGLLPENSSALSPTVLNDAFELLRTNISMQRSVFAFSSLTLVWPFEKCGSGEFLSRMACDYGKTVKKVLVIETEPNSLPKPSGHESHKGLTDLHLLAKEAPPQSEKENEIFWKLYEYVFGTDDKFHCLPYGTASVSPDVLFEKYNFRRILNLLKKHFSLILFNAPGSVDFKKQLPWSTLQDATLVVANYQKHNSVTAKDELKEIVCAQRFVLGGVLIDVPQSTNPSQILKYDVKIPRAS